ncbi:MAG: hypothetical protein HQ513_06650 [Rhodospirillales bacterium]|nr:hypothetical protein [Rhodospirillales bacterium]
MMRMLMLKTGRACERKAFIYAAVSFLSLFSASANLEVYLYLPGIVWILSGTFIAGCWAHEKFCKFEKTYARAPDCSTCGLFGHKIPWILLVSCGLANLTTLSTEWSTFTAYAIALALFSLAGSFLLMRIQGNQPSGDFKP